MVFSTISTSSCMQEFYLKWCSAWDFFRITNSKKRSCSKANFGLLSRGQPHSIDVIRYLLLQFWNEGHLKSRKDFGFISTAKNPSGIERATFKSDMSLLVKKTGWKFFELWNSFSFSFSFFFVLTFYKTSVKNDL